MRQEIMPAWKDIITLRNGGMDEADDTSEAKKHAYFFFLEYILECVAGKKEWKKDKYSCRVSKAVTVSDEAFALLLLNNSWEVFQEYANNENQGQEGARINAKPKFTAKRGGSRRFEGWSRAGIAEYNNLCQRIVADRNSDMGEQFEIEFLEYMKDKCGNKRKHNDDSLDDDDDDNRPLRAWREDDFTGTPGGGGLNSDVGRGGGNAGYEEL